MQRRHRRRVRVNDALRFAGRSAGVEQHRDVVGTALVARKPRAGRGRSAEIGRALDLAQREEMAQVFR